MSSVLRAHRLLLVAPGLLLIARLLALARVLLLAVILLAGGLLAGGLLAAVLLAAVLLVGVLRPKLLCTGLLGTLPDPLLVRTWLLLGMSLPWSGLLGAWLPEPPLLLALLL